MTWEWVAGHLLWTAIVGFVCWGWGWAMAFLDGWQQGVRQSIEMLVSGMEIERNEMDEKTRVLLQEVYESLPALSWGHVGQYSEYTPISGCIACMSEAEFDSSEGHSKDCPMVELRNKVGAALGVNG